MKQLLFALLFAGSLFAQAPADLTPTETEEYVSLVEAQQDASLETNAKREKLDELRAQYDAIRAELAAAAQEFEEASQASQQTAKSVREFIGARRTDPTAEVTIGLDGKWRAKRTREPKEPRNP